MLARVITQDINREGIEALVGAKFDAFTLVEAAGYWKGTREKSLIVEIQTTRAGMERIREFASSIKGMNKQEAVLIETFETKGELV